MRVIIMGCGRVGSELSHELLAAGHEVVVIDSTTRISTAVAPTPTHDHRAPLWTVSLVCWSLRAFMAPPSGRWLPHSQPSLRP